jgi:hypothetical protein
MAEGFSSSLDVLYGGLIAVKKKTFKKTIVSAVFFHFLVIKTLDPDPYPYPEPDPYSNTEPYPNHPERIHLKCWIRIRIQ